MPVCGWPGREHLFVAFGERGGLFLAFTLLGIAHCLLLYHLALPCAMRMESAFPFFFSHLRLALTDILLGCATSSTEYLVPYHVMEGRLHRRDICGSKLQWALDS